MSKIRKGQGDVTMKHIIDGNYGYGLYCMYISYHKCIYGTYHIINRGGSRVWKGGAWYIPYHKQGWI